MLSYWSKLPDDVQKAIVTVILVLAGGAAGGCLPQVCDPAPPPKVSPLPRGSITPMICDPAPPPAQTAIPSPSRTVTGAARTPTRLQTPMICDPPPPPARTASPRASQTPLLCDPPPRPPQNSVPTGTPTPAVTSYVAPSSPLPLAEIRSVQIVWQGGLSFSAESPWPAARFRWFASAGQLDEVEGKVSWRPPAQPGTYLLQVAADWGPAGIAVDALALAVDEDGAIGWL